MTELDQPNRTCIYSSGINCEYGWVQMMKTSKAYSASGAMFSSVGENLCGPKLRLMLAQLPIGRGIDIHLYQLPAQDPPSDIISSAQQSGCHAYSADTSDLIVRNRKLRIRTSDNWHIQEEDDSTNRESRIKEEAEPTYPEREGILGAVFKGDIELSELGARQILSGFQTFGDIDLLNQLAIKQSLQNMPTNTKLRKHPPFSDMADAVLAQRSYNGPKRNIQALISTNNLDTVINDQTEEMNLFRYVIQADLHSTGRGRVGTYVGSSSIIYRARPSKQIWVINKNLTSSKDLSLLDELMANSTSDWLKQYRDSLRNMVSGGLPSLGKRK